MFDVLSLIASVITLTAGINEVVKYTKSFYHASEELGALQACFTFLTKCRLVQC